MGVLNVTEFGARPNDGRLQTDKIQKAIDVCFENGGGEVIIPQGEWLAAGIRLRSGVTLHLQKSAHIIGSGNARDYDVKNDCVEPYDESDYTTDVWTPPIGYENVANDSENIVRNGMIDANKTGDNFEFLRKPLSTWNNGIIRAVDTRNIAVVCDEGAYIDGVDCYDETGEEHYRGPHALSIHRCENVRFKGVHIRNSANWAVALFDSVNIKIDSVTVEAGHDGVHMTSCDNVVIENAEFYCGDDCVAGIDNLNVTVKDCVLNTACSAMRFGGTNFVAENCRAYGPAKYLFRGSLSLEEKKNGTLPENKGRVNMLSFFTFYSDFSREIRHIPSNIKIRNCTVENADRLLHYNYSGNEPWQKNKPLQSIEFENVTASEVKHPITAYGDEKCRFSLLFKECDISFAEDRDELPFMYLCNAERVMFKGTTVRNFKHNTLIKKWDELSDVTFDDFECEEFTGEVCVLTDEVFDCDAI